MQARVFGKETEFGLATAVAGGKLAPPMSPTAFTSVELLRPLTAVYGREMLANGCRAYYYRSHPEWATAEVAHPDDIVTYDRVGELWFLGAINELAEADRRPVLIKNSSDGASTYGSHENYLIPFSTKPQELAPFLISRYVWSGSGGILPDGHGAMAYAISQRAPFIHSEIDSQSTQQHPLINSRDEPLCDASRFRRLHVLAGESNMLSWPLWMRFAVTHLVLRCYEELSPRPTVENLRPLNVRKALANISFAARRWTYDNAMGRSIRCTDAQRVYVELVRRLEDEHGLNGWERQALARWARWLDTLDDDPDALDGEVEWVTKRRWLTRWSDRSSFAGAKVRLAELLWHDIERSPVRRMERSGQLPTAIDPRRWQDAHDTAPADTRAAARGAAVRFCAEHQLPAHISWAFASINHGAAARELRWPDPLLSYPKDAGMLLRLI